MNRYANMGRALAVMAAIGIASLLVPATAEAQQQANVIELEVFEIESEVPRRVAQFFIQRDRLNYRELDEQPTFVPELLETVEDEPF